MKSIPLALSWEFWRQAWIPLVGLVVFLFGFMALIYGGLRIGSLFHGDEGQFASLQVSCFLFVMVALTAVICQLTDSPSYRFRLPVSIHCSIFIPMFNGAIAATLGYVAIALLLNWCFDARWELLKPILVTVCVLSLCQSVAWLIWTTSNLRGAIVAGVSTSLGVGVLFLHGINSPEQFVTAWRTMRPIDIALSVVVPICAYAFSLTVTAFARRGQVISGTALGRWLLAKFDISFASGSHAVTPMSAELWSDWTLKGRFLPIGPIAIATTLCCVYLTGWFKWEAGLEAIVIFTWLQVISGILVGLFLGHVGDRFDFHEHLATRPLSDSQLADVKLRNVVKSVCWVWGTWAISIVVVLASLLVVGQGPASWQEARLNWLAIMFVFGGMGVLVVSWTITSLSASVAVLRPWLIKTLAIGGPSFFILAVLSTGLWSGHEDQIEAMWQWAWCIFSVAGTVVLFVMVLRMRLMTTRRGATVATMYVTVCAVWLTAMAFFPPDVVSMPLACAFAIATSALPFVSIAALPLGIWWNRHR